MKNKYLQRTMEFHRIYQQEILPIFKKEERNRIEFYNKIKTFKSIVVSLYIVTVIVFPVLIYHQSDFKWLICIVWIIFILLSIILTFNSPYDESKFIEPLKSRCLPAILRVFGDISWVNGSECIKNGDLYSSALFADFDERIDDDEFIGTYNDVDFKISETELIKIYKTKNGEEKKRVFKGIILSFESNKTIENRTMIATKGDLTQKNTYLLSIFPIFCLFARIILEFDKANPIYLLIALIASLPIAWAIAYFFRDKEDEPLDEVILEDSKFCKKFNAYSSDQVEARYLLTTAFIERFQNLNTAFGAKKAKCSFFKDQVMFAISTDKNLFEVAKVNKPLTDPKTINEFYNELSAIYKMISYFKLDKKIGL